MGKQYTTADIRNLIFAAQEEYSSNLAGKVFLYVYGEEYFEVLFKTNRFKHLTGIESSLSANRFYQYADRKILAPNQFRFSSQHPRRTAIKKLEQLNSLSVITKEQVCVLKDIKTLSFTYHIGLTNLNFTLCLTADTDLNGQALSEYYVPMSFRIKDKSIENSGNGEFIDFIFERSADDPIYNKLNFAASQKNLPECLKGKIDDKFFSPCKI